MIAAILMTMIFEMNPGPWQTVELSFDEFVPVFRGRRVPEAGQVVPASIRQIGFMLADKTPGPFKLEIRLIEFSAP
jgi:NADH dehydrogenase [ubiquinone] 1 alpha subcomplex assembly factor 1